MSESAHSGVHLDLDGAWRHLAENLPRIDAALWGLEMRFSAPTRSVEEFSREIAASLPPFVLYGSGDFHHLTAIFLRGLSDPVTLVAFDNHPDWDVRPPRWCCGGWINRALELPLIRHASVWGCGNFECWWPYQIFGNRKAERSGRLAVHPWADGRSRRARHRRGAILRENWRKHFAEFAQGLSGSNIYVTIDLDCLAPNLAWTNWENGRFEIEDVNWGLETLHKHARIIGGDLCGAYSVPEYARRKQRFASEADHPRLALPPTETIHAINRAAFDVLWPALTQRNQHYACAD